MSDGGNEPPTSANSQINWVRVWCISLLILGFTFPALGLTIDIMEPRIDLRVGRDFTNHYAAGHLAVRGEGWLAFDQDYFKLALDRYSGILSEQIFGYPPHVLFFDSLFAAFPYWAGLAAWSALGLAGFTWAARSYLPAGSTRWIAAFTPAGFICLWTGQTGLMLGALWLWFFAQLDRAPGRAATAAALMTMKPHLGLLVAIASLRRPQVVIVTALLTAALILASAMVFGLEAWLAFLSETRNAQVGFLNAKTNAFYFRLMPTAYPSYGQGFAGAAAQFLIILGVIPLLWRIRTARSKDLAFPAATATFLILPYGFTYDMTVACLGLLLALTGGWTRLGVPQRIALGAGLMVPSATLFGLSFLAPPLLLYCLKLQTDLIRNGGDCMPERPLS